MKIIIISSIAFLLQFSILLPQYRAVDREPSWVYIGQAKKLIHQGHSGKAMNILQDVIKSDNENADAHYVLASIYYTAGDNKTIGLLMLLTNLLTCSKCLVISVAKSMSIIACRSVRN